MNAVEIISKKRDGGVLSDAEIEFMVSGYTHETIPDYQMSAFLMSCFCGDLNTNEIAALTEVMLNSGERIQFKGLNKAVVDKHSTGGVGDKPSIVLAPLLASVGVAVPMISGRGLGHSGGTVDKLESIPGFSLNQSLDKFAEMVRNKNLCFLEQTSDICPADKKIYGLRDVSGTVPHLGLITASIMSKKIAEGIQGLVLDVKTGNGAFMKEQADARRLAQSLIRVGESHGLKVRALITDMSQPLGHAVGNAIEINEAVAFLRRGPQDGEVAQDLYEVTMALSVEMYCLACELQGEKVPTKAAAESLLEEALVTGKAFAKFLEVVSLQGGDTLAIDEGLPLAAKKVALQADRAGTIQGFDTERVGMALVNVGGGRKKKTDTVDHAVGFYFHKKTGDKVKKGDVIADMYVRDAKQANVAGEMLTAAIEISGKSASAPKMIRGRL